MSRQTLRALYVILITILAAQAAGSAEGPSAEPAPVKPEATEPVKPADCPIVGTMVTLRDAFKDSEVVAIGYKRAKTQAYEGQSFTITRATEVVRVVHRDGTLVRNPETDPNQDMRNVGYDAIRITGKAGTFVVRDDKHWGTPASFTSSQRTEKGIRWGRADRGLWRVKPDAGEDNDNFEFNIITDGPLTGYTLANLTCPRRAAR